MKKIAITAVLAKLVAVAATLAFIGVAQSYAPVHGRLVPAAHPVVSVGVECFEDLSCTDGTSLLAWDCRRPTHVDARGRLVHSNGRCGPGEAV